MNNKRMLAEWENPKSVLVAFPSVSSDWNYIIPRARRQFESLIRAFADNGENVTVICDKADGDYLSRIFGSGISLITDVPFNDTWTRDYGPITVENADGSRSLLDFGFNGWGLKFAADRDNLVNLNLHKNGLLPDGEYQNHREFILEGGSLETDGHGTLLTTSECLCSPNRNGGKSKEEIEPVLRSRLGVDRILWLDHGFLEGDDTDSHIDTLARMAPDDTILYVAAPSDKDDIHHKALSLMREQLETFRTREGKPYRLLPLPFPEPIFDDEGNRLPATYANYLVTGRNLFMPVYGQPANDDLAQRTVALAYPNHRIVPVNCTTLLYQHGSLHCSTMQLY